MPTQANTNLSSSEIDNTSDLIKAAIWNIENFSVLYNKHYVKVYQFIFRRTSDKELTFDLASVVFLKAMENLKNYRFTGIPFEAWLYRIALNEIYSLHRKKKLDLVYNLNTNYIQDIAAEIDSQEKDEMITHVLNALYSLKKEEMDIIEMRFFGKQSVRDIACILNLSENHTSVRIFRILKKLKVIITKKLK
jgi:RNA polymerase sigma-70 factor (ECF subfamily)